MSEDRREKRLELLREALETGTLRRVARMVNALHPSEIANLLEPEYEVSRARLDADLLAFLEQLVEAKILLQS